MCDMQRICGALLTLLPGLVAAQQSAGTELWRLAGTTLAIPPALATGDAAAFWNPAQPLVASPERARFALEAIETAPAVGASGVLLAARARVEGIGQLGLVYGRMSIADLVATSLSPDPDPGVIPYYTEMIGANWGAAVDATTVGVTVARQNTRLDAAQTGRWTLDAGARRSFGGSD